MVHSLVSAKNCCRHVHYNLADYYMLTVMAMTEDLQLNLAGCLNGFINATSVDACLNLFSVRFNLNEMVEMVENNCFIS